MIERLDERYRNGFFVRLGILLLAIFNPLVLLFPAMSETGGDIAALALIGIYCACLVIAFAIVVRFYVRYLCPQCGARLPRKRIETAEGDEHYFYCQHCDTRWKTGISLNSY